MLNSLKKQTLLPPEFSEKANFGKAKFSEKANFAPAEFFSIADFGSATYAKEANFNSAKFSKIANFGEAEFSGQASFGSAKFFGEADFSSTFKDNAYFNYVLFEDGKKILFGIEDLSRFSFMNTDITRVRFSDRARWGEMDWFKVIDEVNLERFLKFSFYWEKVTNPDSEDQLQAKRFSKTDYWFELERRPTICTCTLD